MVDAPVGLGMRGVKLWRLLDERVDLAGPAGVVAHEACRIADRLEALDTAINARGSMLERMHYRLNLDEFHEALELAGRAPVLNVKVTVDNVLGEARQQQGRLAHMLAELGVDLKAAPAAGDGAADPAGESTAPVPAATPLDELQQRRAAAGS